VGQGKAALPAFSLAFAVFVGVGRETCPTVQGRVRSSPSVRVGAWVGRRLRAVGPVPAPALMKNVFQWLMLAAVFYLRSLCNYVGSFCRC